MSILKLPVRIAFRSYAKHKLALLTELKQTAAERVEKALQLALSGESTPEEAQWKSSIENRRNHLLNLDDKLVRTDYGAGLDIVQKDKPNHLRAEKETSIGIVCKNVCKSDFWTSFLFNLVRQFQSRQLLEMGSAVGLSGSYLGAAQRLNGEGKTITLEGDPALAHYAIESFSVLGLNNVELVQGRFTDTLDGVLTGLSAPIDFAFIDGHHDGEATIAYFEQLKPFLTPDAVVVFDDIYWSPSMRSAWEDLQKDEVIRLSVDLQSVGVCVLGPKDQKKSHVGIPMRYA